MLLPLAVTEGAPSESRKVVPENEASVDSARMRGHLESTTSLTVSLWPRGRVRHLEQALRQLEPMSGSSSEDEASDSAVIDR